MDGRFLTNQDAKPFLSLIIPAYNEEAGIAQAIDEAEHALTRLGHPYEILVIDDGSRDNTADIVAEAALGSERVRLLRHDVNRGYGAALRTGFEKARGERIAFTDADCQFELADLGTLLEMTARVPVAVGYRIRRQDCWRRRFFSWGYNQLVRKLLGTRVRDCDCALKLFRKDALANLLPEARGFLVNAEILTRARQRGYLVGEAGVRHRPRARGRSKVSLRDIPRTLAALVPFWWSNVLFPAVDAKQGAVRERIEDNGGPRTWDLGLMLLILVAALLCFSRLGCPLQEPEEARYAEIPRQMLEAASWAVPVLHGEPYYDKPPLLYWLVMASYSFFGVHDWAARLVASTAVFLTIVVTYLWGRATTGRQAALLGALMLCLSARFLYLGRLVTMNGLLALCVTTALAAAHVALTASRRRRALWVLSALACGLGVLTKGPVALVLVAVPLCLWQWLDPRPARIRLRNWLAYLAILLVVAGPWYGWMAARDPGFLGHFFWQQNVVRFLAAFDHQEPIWFYLPGVLGGMLPWTLLLVPLVGFLACRVRHIEKSRPAALGFFVLVCSWCVGFFSAAGCKRAGYILPALPPLALALGCYLAAVLRYEQVYGPAVRLARRSALLARRATHLVLVVGIGGGIVARTIGILPPFAGLILIVSCLIAWIRFVPADGMAPASLWWRRCFVATAALLLAAVHLALPGFARRYSMRGSLRAYAPACVGHELPVFCYPRRWDSVSFYLGRSDVRVFTADQRASLWTALRGQPQSLLIVKTNQGLDEFRGELPASLEFVAEGRCGNVTVGLVRPRAVVPPFLLAWEASEGTAGRREPAQRRAHRTTLRLADSAKRAGRAGATGIKAYPCSRPGES